MVLDLYEGYWQGERLDPFDRVLSSDEKTSIQARIRRHPTLGPGPGRRRRVEAEYERGGALQYLAAWDVQQGRVMGRCEAKTGIEPFGRLVQQVMEHPDYRTPYGRSDVRSRVFWVVDNGSSHRGEASVQRMSQAYANAILVHTPVHASWLNQVEIYFSLLQRKVLTPNDSADLQELELRIRLYEELTNRAAQAVRLEVHQVRPVRPAAAVGQEGGRSQGFDTRHPVKPGLTPLLQIATLHVICGMDH